MSKRTDDVKENSESKSSALSSDGSPIDLVQEYLRVEWRSLRDNYRRLPIVDGLITFACSVGILSEDQAELWSCRVRTCPGHDDEGGRDWCAYCGKMPAEQSDEERTEPAK